MVRPLSWGRKVVGDTFLILYSFGALRLRPGGKGNQLPNPMTSPCGRSDNPI